MKDGKLQIYLDSDDYSKLSDSKLLAKEPKKLEVRDYLIKLVEDEVIEIRYSVLTIAEMIHSDSSVKHYAVERAKLLKKLSRGKVFLPPHSLFFQDALTLAKYGEWTVYNSHDYAYNDTNNWLGYSELYDFVKYFQSCLVSKCKEAIKETGLPRTQRKYLEKRFIRNNRLTPECISSIISADYFKPMQLGSEFFFLEEFSSKENFVRFLKNEISPGEFAQDLLSKMMDAEFVIRKVSEYDSEIQKVMKEFLKKDGNRLQQAVQDVIQSIVDSIEKLLNTGIDATELETKLRRKYPGLIQNGLLKARRRILMKHYEEKQYPEVGLREWEDHVAKSGIGSIPSLDLCLSLMKQFTLERIINKQLKTKLTDGPDLLHASYAPYCDVIRIDKRTHDLISKLPSDVTAQFNTIFVKLPEDLPDAIERKLGQMG